MKQQKKFREPKKNHSSRLKVCCYPKKIGVEILKWTFSRFLMFSYFPSFTLGESKSVNLWNFKGVNAAIEESFRQKRPCASVCAFGGAREWKYWVVKMKSKWRVWLTSTVLPLSQTKWAAIEGTKMLKRFMSEIFFTTSESPQAAQQLVPRLCSFSRS